MKQTKKKIWIFFSKWQTQKNWVFQNRQFSKFHGLVLGLVELIDVAQPISLRDSPAKAQKQAKNAFFVFLRLRQKASRPYKLSYIASINPTDWSTNAWNYHNIFLRIGDFEKLRFFLSRPFWIHFFKKKKKNFASSPWKLVTNYVIEWMGLSFDVFFRFQQIPSYAW
jgi:hypothetical protein